LNRKRCGIDPPIRRRGFNFSNIGVPSAGKRQCRRSTGGESKDRGEAFGGRSENPICHAGKEFAGGRDKAADDD
jgi:hypothetical protein